MLKTIVSTFQTVLVMGSSLSHQSAVDTIHQWRAKPAHELIFDSGRREISHYMQAVDRLHQSPGSNELISTATARLKLEFHSVLSRQADHHQAGPISTTEWSSISDSTAYAFRYEEYIYESLISNDVIIYLRNVAERMNNSNKIGDCVKIYKTVRKQFIQNLLKRLRFEEISLGGSSNGSSSSTRRYIWDELKVKIDLWVQVSKICVIILFEKEKILCDQIFGGINDVVKDECFVGTVEDFAIGLFGFANAISSGNHPYDRMETILALYHAFVTVVPNADALFWSERGKRIRVGCVETLARIENDVARMLHDFENEVLRGMLNACDDRGGVCDLTKYVMEQIDHIVKNRSLLTRLIKSTPSLNFGDRVIPREDLVEYSDNRTFLELHLILIIFVLQMNLESKSKCYENPSFGQLFTMNNVRYIIQKIEGSHELRRMIGDSYMKKLNEDVKFAKDSYEALTCSKFLNCLDDEGLYITRCFKPRMSKTALKKRLKNFNSVFEEIDVLHCAWTVPDTRLRDEVRVSLSEKVVPAYKKFLDKFRSDPDLKLLQERNVKYSAEDLEALVLEKLFTDAEVA